MIHKAKDLSEDQRKVIESLLGRTVLEAEAISVRAFEPPAVPDAQRLEITEKLKKYFAEVDAIRQPVSNEEADATITEAIRNSRPQYRPHH